MSGERILVVIPAYREEATVGGVVTAVRAAGFDCVVVDDGSPDRTTDVARAAGAVVLRLAVNLGVGAALRCGFRYADSHGYDGVVQCDADGQHPPEAIVRLIEAAREHDAHLVIGSRFTNDSGRFDLPRGRRLVMRTLSFLVARAGHVRVRDTSSGFRYIGRPLLGEFARTYPAQYLGDTVEALVAAGRAGYRVVEVPADLLPRAGGEASARPLRAMLLTARVAITVIFGIGVRLAPAAATVPALTTTRDRRNSDR
ncbi:MAG: glycosyltransferase family 2 protein [Acidimicrobiia bacterium]